MEAYIDINDCRINCYKGGRATYLDKNVLTVGELKVSYGAQVGYNRVSCLVKIGSADGTSTTHVIYDCNDQYYFGSCTFYIDEYTILVMVYLQSWYWNHEDEWDLRFQPHCDPFDLQTLCAINIEVNNIDVSKIPERLRHRIPKLLSALLECTN